MQYGRVRTGSVGDSTNNDDWGDGSDNENMPAGRMHVNAHDRISLEQWHKQRVRKLSIAGLFFLSTLVLLLVLARTKGNSTALTGGESQTEALSYTKMTVTDSAGTPFKCGFQDAAYYIRRGSRTRRWLIYLGSSTEGNNVFANGGGLCGDVDECKALAAERPETSTVFEGILSSNSDNPFSDWQVVYVPWCSGFAFATGVEKSLTDGRTLKSEGPAMLDRLFTTLETGSAEVVVLAGTGTGGMQALMRANGLKEETGAAKVMVIADSAFVVNNRSSDVFEEAYTLAKDNPSGGTFNPNLDGDCKTANAAAPWKCMWPDEFLQHTYSQSTDIPVFIAQSLYDTWALENLVPNNGNNCFNPTTFAPTGDCSKDSIDLETAHAYKNLITKNLQERFYIKDTEGVDTNAAPKSLGMWIMMCPAHGLLCHDDTYLNPEPSHWFVQHKDLGSAIGSWVEYNLNPDDDDEDPHIFIDGNNGNVWKDDMQCPTRTVATR